MKKIQKRRLLSYQMRFILQKILNAKCAKVFQFNQFLLVNIVIFPIVVANALIKSNFFKAQILKNNKRNGNMNY